MITSTRGPSWRSSIRWGSVDNNRDVPWTVAWAGGEGGGGQSHTPCCTSRNSTFLYAIIYMQNPRVDKRNGNIKGMPQWYYMCMLWSILMYVHISKSTTGWMHNIVVWAWACARAKHGAVACTWLSSECDWAYHNLLDKVWKSAHYTPQELWIRLASRHNTKWCNGPAYHVLCTMCRFIANMWGLPHLYRWSCIIVLVTVLTTI